MNASIQDHSPRQVLTKRHVSTYEGVPALALTANGQTAHLPLLNVNQGKQDAPPVWIAWFDPLVSQVSRVGVEMLVPYIVLLKPDLAIQPASSKSETMIRTAVQRAEDALGRAIPLITLLGGVDREEVEAALRAEGIKDDQLAEWHVSYVPITGKVKYMAILPDVVEQMVETLRRGGQIVLLDDIYSSGATIEAARTLLGRAFARHGCDAVPEQIPVIAVAQEVEGDYDDAQRQAANLFCGAVIPVIVGSLEADAP